MIAWFVLTAVLFVIVLMLVKSGDRIADWWAHRHDFETVYQRRAYLRDLKSKEPQDAD